MCTQLQHWRSTGLRPQGLLEQQRLTEGLGGSCRNGFENLGVLGVWSLANGRLGRPKNRGLEQQGQRLGARKRQVSTLAHNMLTATRLGGTAKAHRRALWKLPRRI